MQERYGERDRDRERERESETEREGEGRMRKRERAREREREGIGRETKTHLKEVRYIVEDREQEDCDEAALDDGDTVQRQSSVRLTDGHVTVGSDQHRRPDCGGLGHEQ